MFAPLSGPHDDHGPSGPIDRDRLLRMLASGGRHDWLELAEASTGRRDGVGIERTRSLLSLPPWRGMALAIDAAGVRAAPFVPLDAAALVEALGGSWRVTVALEAGSTNSELLHEVRQRPDATRPALRAAEFQTEGRGRLGRRWASSAGGSLTVSFALRVRRRLAELDGVTLVCGLAVRRVLASLGVDAGLKWPNDLLVADRKVAGILVEAHPRPSGTVLVIGVGVNLTSPPDDGAAALRLHSLPMGWISRPGDAPIDRNRLAAAIGLALRDDLAIFDGTGFRRFMSAWNVADAFVGRPVALHDATSPPRRGIARGVDESGALRLEANGVQRRFIAGEVSLRPDTGGVPG